MNIEEESKIYFEDNAVAWLNNAYLNEGYDYSVPLNRLRVIKKILSQMSDVKNILDIGCGGAHLDIELAKLGFNVTAVDQSQEMLRIAKNNISKESKYVQQRIVLKSATVDDRDTLEPYDCVIAMGLIGYLESDEKLFQSMKKNLAKNGVLIVSFRNQLFNLFSISHRTICDIERGEFARLAEEAAILYTKIPLEKAMEFLRAMNMATNELLHSSLDCDDHVSDKAIPYSQSIEPRQTTPKQAREIAEKCGYYFKKFIGIHPHFSVPGLNKALPSGVYNKISDSLIPFEEEDIALLWSSVFIGVFTNL